VLELYPLWGILGHFGPLKKTELTKDHIGLTTSALGTDLSIEHDAGTAVPV